MPPVAAPPAPPTGALLEQVRANLTARLVERDAAQAEVDAVLTLPTTEARDLNADEATTFAARRAALTAIDDDVATFRSRIEQLEDVELRRWQADQLPRSPHVRVGHEPTTYRQGGEHNFLTDAWRASSMSGAHDTRAVERIARHSQEMDVVRRTASDGTERRDVGTSAFGALVVPQYLTDLWAPLMRAGRPIANAVRSLDLPPEGMVLNIPRITTGTATAIQATENTAVQETDLDETTLAINVRTIAGQQDVSRQAIERGRMVPEIVFMDLGEAYSANLDSDIINSDGTSGTNLGIRSTSGIIAVTYTDASPTVAEIWPKLQDAEQQVSSNRFLNPTCWFMHPRRWGWFKAALDTTNRPLISLEAPQNPMGVGTAGEYGQIVGTLSGLPVITDANIPTNLGGGTEDMIFCVRASDLLLFEQPGDPKELRFEQTLGGSLTVKLVLYGYVAFAAGRYPKAIATIGGTGLAAPTF